MSDPASATALAAAVAQALYARDPAAHQLGIHIRHCAPGRAELTMTVTDFMLNGHGTCHGGYLFTLADTAFAYACNSGNELTVGQHASIDYLRSARAGETLTALAQEVKRARAAASTTWPCSGPTANRWRCSAACRAPAPARR